MVICSTENLYYIVMRQKDTWTFVCGHGLVTRRTKMKTLSSQGSVSCSVARILHLLDQAHSQGRFCRGTVHGPSLGQHTRDCFHLTTQPETRLTPKLACLPLFHRKLIRSVRHKLWSFPYDNFNPFTPGLFLWPKSQS